MDETEFGIPGKHVARVVEVRHSGALQKVQISYDSGIQEYAYTRRDPFVVGQMIKHGIAELTGIGDPQEGWLSLIQPGERVGIKVDSQGGPECISSYEVVSAVVEQLIAVGVGVKDIVIFDRFRSDFLQFAYDRFLPRGVRWECMAERLTEQEDGAIDSRDADDHVSGYSPEHCISFPRASPMDNAVSYLCRVVASRVDKFICIPVLKEQSGRNSFALENLSNGLFSNNYRHSMSVSPSKSLATGDATARFIAATASHPVVRKKCVLIIGDAIWCAYNGGPGAWNPHFRYAVLNALFLGTDPVALDAAGVNAIEALRRKHKLPPLMKPLVSSIIGVHYSSMNFGKSLLQHILSARQSGLGEVEPERHTVLNLTRSWF